MHDSTLDERFGGVLAPDAMLPSQFFAALRGNATLLTGERRLMIAVLEDALHCFQKYADSEDPKHRQLFADAEAWINAENPTWFFSFSNVCETLDLDPDFVREGLAKWRAARRRTAAASGSGHVPRAEHDGSESDEPTLRRASGGA